MATVSIPHNHFQSVSFELKRFTQVTMLAGGRTQIREYAPSRWMAQYRTAPLTEAQRRAFMVFFSQVADGTNNFLGYDPSAAVPVAYAANGGGLTFPAVGSWPYGVIGVGRAEIVGPFTITLSAMPVGFTVAPGDMVSLEWYGAWWLLRLTTGGTFTGAPFNVDVEPRIPYPTPFPTGTQVAAYWYFPPSLMLLEPDSVQHIAEAGQMPSISFSAFQKVL